MRVGTRSTRPSSGTRMWRPTSPARTAPTISPASPLLSRKLFLFLLSHMPPPPTILLYCIFDPTIVALYFRSCKKKSPIHVPIFQRVETEELCANSISNLHCSCIATAVKCILFKKNCFSIISVNYLTFPQILLLFFFY
jgi:hypothetical protein